VLGKWLAGFRLAKDKILETMRVIRYCQNWPSVLVILIGGHLPLIRSRLPRDFIFISRSGQILRAPRGRDTQSPLMEVLLDDVYHLSRLPWIGDRSYPLRVVDVGAHVGSFSFAIVLQFPGASVTCYEPSPVANAYLDGNVQQNGLTSRIRTVAAAVDVCAGQAVLHQTRAGSAGATLFSNSPSFPGSSGFEVGVDVVGVAEAFEAARSPELVKLDCEGSEYAIVLESDSSVWSSVRCVLLEYHSVPGHSWTELMKRFEDLGFRCAWHDPNPREGFGVAMLVRS